MSRHQFRYKTLLEDQQLMKSMQPEVETHALFPAVSIESIDFFTRIDLFTQLDRFQCLIAGRPNQLSQTVGKCLICELSFSGPDHSRSVTRDVKFAKRTTVQSKIV